MLQRTQNSLCQVLWRCLRTKASNHLTVFVDQKLCKVPCYVSITVFACLLTLEKLVKVACISAIHFNFAEHLKVHVVLCLRKF